MGIYPRVSKDKSGVRGKDVVWIITERTTRKIPGWTTADTATQDVKPGGQQMTQGKKYFSPRAQTRGIMRIGFHPYDRAGGYDKQRHKKPVNTKIMLL